jgi:hypothetical protein
MSTRPLVITLGLVAALAAAACQTMPAPETPATSTSLAGPPPRGTVLQRARDDQPLFPAKEGAGGHHHHHHAPAAAPTPVPPPPGGGR